MAGIVLGISQRSVLRYLKMFEDTGNVEAQNIETSADIEIKYDILYL
jgi:hypothetical protein